MEDRLRVALVYPSMSLVAGVPQFHVLLARYLVAAGHEVHVYGLACESDVELAPGIVFHEVPAGPLQETRAGLPRSILRFTRAATRMIEREREACDVVHVRGEWLLSPDIYHLTGTQRGERRAWLAAREQPVSFSRGLKDLAQPLARPAYPVLARLERRILAGPRLARIHAESWRVKDDVVSQYGIDPDQIEVVPPPVDVKRFSPGGDRRAARAELGAAPSDFVVLFCGHAFERKGLDRAILALSRAREPALLVVAGGGTHSERGWNGSTADAYRRLAAECGVGERVRLVGSCAGVERLYRAADAFTLPTRFDVWGTAVIEAMASGLPPVVSDTAGAASAVTDGVDGFVLRAPFAVDELARRLDLLARDRLLRERLGRAARARAEELGVERVYGRVEQAMLEVRRARAPRARIPHGRSAPGSVAAEWASSARTSSLSPPF